MRPSWPLVWLALAVAVLPALRPLRWGITWPDAANGGSWFAKRHIWLRKAWRDRQRDDCDKSVAWAFAIAADLRAGVEPNAALSSASERMGVAPRASAAWQVGGDVSEALLSDAEDQDAQLLRSVAACWSVGVSTGAGLATVIEAIADGHRQSMQVRQSLVVELAGPRATARLMTMLPVVGLALAWLLGVNPFLWLTGSPLGWATLVVGIALNLLGAVWTRQLVADVAGVV